MPHCTYVDHGAALTDYPRKLDRGGCINSITPHNNTSKKVTAWCQQFPRAGGKGHR
jgi:hypothetical protein